MPVEKALTLVAGALDGSGDALLPVPPDDPSGDRLAALEPLSPLRPGEDDDADPTALVLATSGSTGVPKGALLHRSALVSSARATHARLGGPGTWLLALAAHHVAGVQVLVRSLVAGTEPEVLDLASGFHTAAFVEATARLRQRAAGRRYTSLVPTQLSRLLDAGPDAVDALGSFDAVLVGGQATPPLMVERARAAGVRLVTTYGMSETCGGCVYDGSPLDGVDVRCADDGRVSIAGPVLARGYRLRPADPAFANGWFCTDDIGTLDGGTLRIRGRADDVLVTGGLKVSPSTIEAVLADLPQVREGVVVGIADAEWGQIVVAVVVPREPSAPPTLQQVRAFVAARLGPESAPRHLVVVDRLPTRGPGKPDRQALVAMLDAER